MFKRQPKTENNVVSLFSKKRRHDGDNVDYSLLNRQIARERQQAMEIDEKLQRNNVVSIFPNSCA